MTTIGVLAVQGDVREHRAMLEQVGTDTVDVRYVDELDGIDGLVIPGGESTAIINLLKRQELVEPLRAQIAEGLPVYGSCAGMILLSDKVEGREDQELLGGMDIAVKRNAFGRQVASFEAPVYCQTIGDEPFHGIFIRAPWAEVIGDGVEVLGTVTDHEGQTRAVALRQGSLFVTAFHPELTDDTRMHEYFVREIVQS
ncbi:MAG: pyridoxal 5'-phosphate synthase glutaminase subunit PdxT [Candidatus Nanopelagicales bacterium]